MDDGASGTGVIYQGEGACAATVPADVVAISKKLSSSKRPRENGWALDASRQALGSHSTHLPASVVLWHKDPTSIYDARVLRGTFIRPDAER